MQDVKDELSHIKNEMSYGVQVPYYVYDCIAEKEKENRKQLLKIIVALIIALFLTNAIWLYCWMQYDYVTTEDIGLENNEKGNIMYQNGEIFLIDILMVRKLQLMVNHLTFM